MLRISNICEPANAGERSAARLRGLFKMKRRPAFPRLPAVAGGYPLIARFRALTTARLPRRTEPSEITTCGISPRDAPTRDPSNFPLPLQHFLVLNVYYLETAICPG